MIKNYFRSAWRSLVNQKFISFINLFGLTMGLASCLLIGIYIKNELAYDKFNQNAESIYRVTRTFYATNGSETLHLSAIAPPFAALIKSAFPQIENLTQILPNGRTIVRYRDKLFYENNAFFADENFQGMFGVQMLNGEKNGLKNPYEVLLSDRMAQKYFPSQDALNKLLVLDNNKHPYKVAGVFKSFPVASHLHPDFLMSFNTLNDPVLYGTNNLRSNWGDNSFYTYLLLSKSADAAIIQRQLPEFLDQYVHIPFIPSNVKTSAVTKLSLQKLTAIHLRSHLDDEIEQNGDIGRVYTFSVIALFILFIAGINYMNLSTARAVLRAREIGIRKVIGARQREIAVQLLLESVLITLMATLLALGVAWALLPFINRVSGLNLSFAGFFTVKILILLPLTSIFIGLISGLYPSVFISSFKPVKVLKGFFKAGAGNASFREVLVVIQFSISIILLVATTVVFQQLQYIRQKSLGFNKDHVIVIPYSNLLNKNYNAFKAELLQDPGIKDMGRSSRVPSGRLLDYLDMSVTDNGSAAPVKSDVKFLTVDDGFIPSYGIKLAAGRNFSPRYLTDTSAYLINESAAAILGWKNVQSAIGKNITYGRQSGQIIGVTRDFHFESLHQQIAPLLLRSSRGGNYGNLSVKAGSADLPATINSIKTVWQKYLPEVPFDFSFLDEKFEKLYNGEHQQQVIFTVFSLAAIFIACLGLFGLSAFIITQRVKEIGVRKILGANVPQILAEVSKDFLKLVIVAAFIAFPVSWYLMNRWLTGFAFRIHIQWWVFLSAGITALVIALLTISFQSIKAALANPVKSLRNE